MASTIILDVYGTLVDPVEMGRHLNAHLGDQSEAFSQLWHEKKVEYSFRRGLMQQYQDFGVCTEQALNYCLSVFQIEISEPAQQRLLAELRNLEAFGDVEAGLTGLKGLGHKLVAFSNGPEVDLTSLLTNSGILPHLDDVISVDDLKTFKPNPTVYEYAAKRMGAEIGNCWMVSSNPWDVIGGKAAGMNAAWVKRDSGKVFDPWEFTPDLVVRDLVELSENFAV